MNEVFKNITQILKNLASVQSPLPQEISILLQQRSTDITQAYDNAVKAFMHRDSTVANDVLDLNLKSEVSTINQQLFQEQQIEDIIAITRLIDNLQYILVFAYEIAEIAIDKSEEPQQ